MATVVMLVVLRLSLGCHFLYEGVWKIKNARTFSAALYLSEAKGPAAPLYYAMLPDLEGRQRLGITEQKDGTIELAAEKDPNGKVLWDEEKDASGKVVAKYSRYKLEAYLSAWSDFIKRLAAKYGLTDEQKQQAERLYEQYAASARQYVSENEDAIVAHFQSRRRFAAEQAAGNRGAAHQRERAWNQERDYRRELGGWLAELDSMGKDYQAAVWNLLTEEQKAVGQPGKGWNVLAWPRLDQLNAAMTWSLTAIGLCLMLGLFTRLAALGGAAFMLNVVLSQPAWPGLFPPDPAVVGHALLVNKDFVEMVALLVVATTPVGRWGGLDFFVHNLFTRPFLSRKIQSTEKKEGTRR